MRARAQRRVALISTLFDRLPGSAVPFALPIALPILAGSGRLTEKRSAGKTGSWSAYVVSHHEEIPILVDTTIGEFRLWKFLRREIQRWIEACERMLRIEDPLRATRSNRDAPGGRDELNVAGSGFSGYAALEAQLLEEMAILLPTRLGKRALRIDPGGINSPSRGIRPKHLKHPVEVSPVL